MKYITITTFFPTPLLKELLFGVRQKTSPVPRNLFFYAEMTAISEVFTCYQDKARKWHRHALPVVCIRLWDAKIDLADPAFPHVRATAQCHPFVEEYDLQIYARDDYLYSDAGANLREAVLLGKLEGRTHHSPSTALA